MYALHICTEFFQLAWVHREYVVISHFNRLRFTLFFYQNGDTAVHIACRHNRKGVLQLLIKAGANLEAKRMISSIDGAIPV
jgi:hypothetical protein